MIITLDKLSSRYHQLPSVVLANATTFDLYVMDIGVRYEHIQQQKSQGTYVEPIPQLTQEEMKAMIAGIKKDVKN